MFAPIVSLACLVSGFVGGEVTAEPPAPMQSIERALAMLERNDFRGMLEFMLPADQVSLIRHYVEERGGWKHSPNR